MLQKRGGRQKTSQLEGKKYHWVGKIRAYIAWLGITLLFKWLWRTVCSVLSAFFINY